jgi:uncharacterized RDD family membrane protein YckC
VAGALRFFLVLRMVPDSRHTPQLNRARRVPPLLRYAGPILGRPAALNGPLARICSQCGSISPDDAEVCAFCEGSLLSSSESKEPDASSESEWRVELAKRLEAYRARRRQLRPDDSQTALPFSQEPLKAARDSRPPVPSAPPLALPRARQAVRVDISAPQTELEFASPDHRFRPQSALVPVADLGERRMAGLIDTAILTTVYAGFLVLFHSLGGQLAFDRMDSIVYAAAFFLLYAQYFTLFTIFGGPTPGMLLRGISVVRLDGTLPDTRPLLWRSFGYLLSGLTLLLGFLWSLWDEDHFSWHDRISQTYLTLATPLADSGLLRPLPKRHTSVHR